MFRLSFEIQSFGPAPVLGQLPQITDKNVLIDSSTRYAGVYRITDDIELS
jgi:hypothetical protein